MTFTFTSFSFGFISLPDGIIWSKHHVLLLQRYLWGVGEGNFEPLNIANLSHSPSSNPVRAELSLFLHFSSSPAHQPTYPSSHTWKYHLYTKMERSSQCRHKLAVSVQNSGQPAKAELSLTQLVFPFYHFINPDKCFNLQPDLEAKKPGVADKQPPGPEIRLGRSNSITTAVCLLGCPKFFEWWLAFL